VTEIHARPRRALHTRDVTLRAIVALARAHLFRTRAQLLRTLLLTLLLMGALLNLGCALAIVWRPDEVRYGESILYAHAGRILAGEPLYQPIDQPPYTVAAYTPLY
jgi:hypothetical protein